MSRQSWASALATLALMVACAQLAAAQVVNSEWNTGSGAWNVPANWFPNAVPDNGGGITYNVQIGNRPVAASAAVTFVPASGTSDTITSIAVSGAADLSTNGSQLNVIAATTLDGVGTTIQVEPHPTPGTAAFTSLDVNVNNGANFFMSGGIAEVTRELEINAGSVLGGYGTVNVGDGDLAVEQAFENSSFIQVQGSGAAPQTLTIHANGVDTLDLDGDSETGTIDVDNALANVNADTITLVIDGPLDDPFSGTLQIGQRDTVTFNDSFVLDGSNIVMDGGNSVARLNGLGHLLSITGATFTVSGAAVIANDMGFADTTSVVTVNANSSLELQGGVTIPDASALVLASNTSQLIISDDVTTVSEAAGDFNWDGPGTAITTVKGSGQLTLAVNRVDTADDIYGGTLNLNDNGSVGIDNAANVWTLAGTLNKNNLGTSFVGGDLVSVTGDINVTAGQLTMPQTRLESTASVNVAGTFVLGSNSILAGPAAIAGTGTLRMAGASTVTSNTIVGTSSFDWDGLSNVGTHTINDGVVFTINSTTFDSDGDMDDPISLGGSGAALAINNVASWTMNRTLTTNATVAGIASINGNARMIMSGALAIWNANGQTSVNAPVTFGASSTANIAAAGFIRLNGGDAVSVFNRIEGATINGPGGLIAINARELQGFGTINAPITFQNTSSLRADDGALTIAGAINQVSSIGTADVDGVLNVVNAWNSNVAANVVLRGGTLQGGAITVANANGISGNGLVASRVINNTRLLANDAAQTLVFETAANNNDWDGGANTGILAASNAATLELRDNATFTYGGTVTAIGASRVYAKGFGFNFAPTSAINLTSSKLQTDESTSFDGAINIGPGADSTLEVQVNRFLTVGSTAVVALDGNLRLQTNNGAIEAGAAFSGAGAVIVPAGSHLILESGSNVNALLANEGTIRPAGFNAVGAATVKDFQLANSSKLEFELTGTLLNQFDRIAATGVAQLDGFLSIDIDGVFVPALGNTFNIITAPSVLGQFDYYDVSGMPVGLAFKVNYLANAVQLQVVNKPIFSADFDDDGDVDPTDLAIWRGAFNLNQLGDADGDNDSDGADFLMWQQQLGSKPTAVAATAAVPEPCSAVLLLNAAVAFVGSVVRRRSPGRCQWLVGSLHRPTRC